MKPTLEVIPLEDSQKSFRFFKLETPAFTPFWHYHPEMELTLITKGSGTRFVGDAIQPFAAMDLVLIGENLPHHWVSVEETHDILQEAYVFQFDKQLFASFPECNTFISFFEHAKDGFHFYQPKTALINMIVSLENKSPIQQLSGLIEILNTLLQDEHKKTLASKHYLNRFYSTTSQSKIAKTTNYILENIDQKLTVKQMAALTHMVPQSFCRWFKKHSGHSFVTFLNKTRIERACHLLKSTSLPVQNIAFHCGFDSLSHFNRTFKKMKMMSPSQFRNLSKDGN
ncbi:HTH-type transcriptional activator Btr [Kordia sp. SMS9]|uniref:AraC family transcriptional regulator n=1 Tax=Kordia sp. SMS9 TaxID=2282170 RepID=UPI000E0CC660|nr:AraC family transcriptional regulator [Kordia sp. SMS9]AXG70765.1 HTH-type transcriptional activator Btr [Kordia sp. SMS9]